MGSPVTKTASSLSGRKQQLSELKTRRKATNQVMIKGKQTEAEHILLLDGQEPLVYPVESPLTFNNVRDQ